MKRGTMRLDALVDKHSHWLVKLLRDNAHTLDDEDRALIRNALYGFAQDLTQQKGAR
jgi:hypothetical protein